MPTGTLTMKTQCQDQPSTSQPPSTGPAAGATAVGSIRIRVARIRSSCGKARKSMVIPTGVSRPPAAPWKIR